MKVFEVTISTLNNKRLVQSIVFTVQAKDEETAYTLAWSMLTYGLSGTNEYVTDLIAEL